MTSAQVVETSVTNNSSFQNYPHPDDHTIRTTDTSGFKPFTMLRSLGRQSEQLANNYISSISTVRRIRQQLWFNHRCKDHGLVPAGLKLKSPLNTQEGGHPDRQIHLQTSGESADKRLSQKTQLLQQ